MVVGANEDVLVWEIKIGGLLSRWSVPDNKAQVSAIVRSHVDKDVFAVGYDDGRIRVWDIRTTTIIVSFNGHKSAITQLKFDDSGVKLASGSTDTDIILWDLVSEKGLYKLRGHKGQITSLYFLYVQGKPHDFEENVPNFIVSASKDSLIKVWDLSTQYCVETHVAQSNGECWALGLSADQSGLLSGGNDGELKAWAINHGALANVSRGNGEHKILQERGAFYRHSKDRIIEISFHPKANYIAIHGGEKAIEIWRIRDESELSKVSRRKRKRQSEKEEKLNADFENQRQDSAEVQVTDIFVPFLIVRAGGKVRSIDWAATRTGKSFDIIAATTNNQVEVYEIRTSEKSKNKIESLPDYSRTFSIDVPGHRTDIRCVALSSDDRMLATASNGSLKIWNVKTQSCIRTLDCGHALCISFLPGDRIVVIGTRDGTLELFDISASILLESAKAHDRDIWALQVHPDGKSLVTGSADKSAKFWNFKIIQEEVPGTTRKNTRLTLVHTRTLKVVEDILSVCYSPDSRLLAVSTLDNTVKVFFVDTLKLFLTLYGHKLPVLDIDISYDSKLVVTCGADKNVRIWGLDFGDCHKALFAHQDSILSVNFMPNNNEGNGHHFFSASKDKTIKYYDGDKFEQIQRLDGHHGEIWATVMSHSGEFFITASHDKSIRVWQQTDEQIFLEEERERELEQMNENTLLTSLDVDDQDTDRQEVAAAGKQTVETLMAGERIAEALEFGLEDLGVMQEYERVRAKTGEATLPQRNPVFLAHNNNSATEYVHYAFQKIPAASLQDALLVLSFTHLPALLTFLAIWADEGRNIPLTCRVLLFMLKTHQKQVVSSRMMRPLLQTVKSNLRKTLFSQKAELGYNLAGLRVLGRRLRDEGDRHFIDESSIPAETTHPEQSKRRAFVNVA